MNHALFYSSRPKALRLISDIPTGKFLSVSKLPSPKIIDLFAPLSDTWRQIYEATPEGGRGGVVEHLLFSVPGLAIDVRDLDANHHLILAALLSECGGFTESEWGQLRALLNSRGGGGHDV